MYHPKIVQAKINQALKTGQITQPPTYYSRAEVGQYVNHFNSLRVQDDKKVWHMTREFTPDEITFIADQRFLCRVDFRYFISRYCWIKNEEDMMVQFDPWPSQEMFLDILAENELARIAIELQVLKARQLGLSRITSLAILHRVIFFPYINSVIASCDPSKTGLLAGMLEFCLNHIPYWMTPKFSLRESAKQQGMGEWLEFGETGTAITLQHGAQFNGMARGTTPTVCHISELCEFDDPENLIDASLLRSTHPSRNSFLVLESTALGQHNWWHDTWLSSKEGWPEHRSRLRPVFLPWFSGGLYPKPDWLRARPVPENYVPLPWVSDHARRAAAYVRNNDLLTRYLGKDWAMPVEQQWFYEVDRGEAVRKNRLNKWLQEMPASDDEAFQSTNYSVFSTEVITAHRDRCIEPIGVYGIQGSEDIVPARLQPDRTLIDTTKPVIPIVCQLGTRPATHYKLVPLRWQGYSTDSGLDKIYLWEHPQPGEIYGLGIDTSKGIGKDRSVIEILRKGNMWRPAAQVGEFASNRVNAMDLAPIATALATYFSTPDPTDPYGMLHQPRLAIECLGDGDQTQLRLRFNGFTNFHPWRRIDNKNLAPDQYNKIGVYTTNWFRSGLMEFMLTMLRDMELEIRSPYFVHEMQSLEGDMFRQALKAASGAHDDRYMALGFIVVSLYQWEKDRRVSVSMDPNNPNQAPALVKRYASYPGNAQEKPMGVH